MPGGKSYNRGRKQGQKKIKPVPAPADDALSVQLLTPGATTPPAEIGGRISEPLDTKPLLLRWSSKVETARLCLFLVTGTGLVLGPDTEVTPASESGCLHCVLVRLGHILFSRCSVSYSNPSMLDTSRRAGVASLMSLPGSANKWNWKNSIRHL